MIFDDLYNEFNMNDMLGQSFLQRYILSLLYYATKGWSWYFNFNFLAPVDVCHWNILYYENNFGYAGDGIQCDM